MAMPQVTYVCYREFRITMDYTFCFPHLYILEWPFRLISEDWKSNSEQLRLGDWELGIEWSSLILLSSRALIYLIQYAEPLTND